MQQDCDYIGPSHRLIGHSAVVLEDDNIYVFGGENIHEKTMQNTLYQYHVDGNVVTCTAIECIDGPDPRAWHTATRVEFEGSTAMLVAGGMDSNYKPLDEVWILKLEEETSVVWTKLQLEGGDSPFPLAYHTATSIENGGKIVVFGGFDGEKMQENTNLRILDLETKQWSSLELSGVPVEPMCWHSAAEIWLCFDKETKSPVAPLADAVAHEMQRTECSQIVLFGGICATGESMSNLTIIDACIGTVSSIQLSNNLSQGLLIARQDRKVAYLVGNETYELDFAQAQVCTTTEEQVPEDEKEEESPVIHQEETKKVVKRKDIVFDLKVTELRGSEEIDISYTGDVWDGIPHGQGEARMKLGEHYVGEWKNGRRDGFGTCTYYDGTVYKGKWKNGKRNGYGRCEIATTRDIYHGKWVGDVRCGKGKCEFANGHVFDGEWKNNVPHGNGVLTKEDGIQVVGQWKDGTLIIS